MGQRPRDLSRDDVGAACADVGIRTFLTKCVSFLFPLHPTSAPTQQCLFTISTAEVGVIEAFGKYNRLSQPGLGFICCPYEQLVGRLSFRVQQLDVRVETKTSDNVFITAVVSVQYQILREKVRRALMHFDLFVV